MTRHTHEARHKTLRVLTGLHAGASLRLAPGNYRLVLTALEGADEARPAAPAEDAPPLQGLPDAAPQPITFLDWQGPAVSLHIDATGGAAGGVRLRTDDTRPSTEPSAPLPVERWDDLQPRRVGGLVLCVGDADAPWPSDAQLLARLRQETAARSTPPPGYSGRPAAGSARGLGPLQGRGRYTATGLGVGLLLAVSTLFGGPGHPPPPHMSTPLVAAPDLQRTLSDHGLTELRVRQAESGLVVEGLVRDAQQDSIAQQLVAPLRAGELRTQWDIADDVAATIDAALRAPAVRTRYLGDGRFVTEGSADSPERVQASAAQLRRDLGGNLKELTVNVAAIRRTAPVTSAVAAGGLRYDERRDGTKRFGTEQK